MVNQPKKKEETLLSAYTTGVGTIECVDYILQPKSSIICCSLLSLIWHRKSNFMAFVLMNPLSLLSLQSNKPIMEKRRRARINNCLNELKTLILDATKKDVSLYLSFFLCLEMLKNYFKKIAILSIESKKSITNDY